MNQSLMRRLDAWIGKLVCLLLSFHSKFFRRSVNHAAPRSILFIKLIEQGASVLAANAFNRACELVGKDHVYLCVFTENRPIIDVLGQLKSENVWVLRNDNLLVFAIDLWRMLVQARKVGIEATVDLEFFSRGSAIISYLTGARHRVGLHRFTMDGPYRGDLMTHQVSYNPYLHTAVTYRLMVDALVEPPGETPRNKMSISASSAYSAAFTPQPREIATVEALLRDRVQGNMPQGPRIILNPNASDMLPLRKWPTDRFHKLAQSILAEYPDALIILTGAPREAAPAERIRDELNSARVVSLAGATTMEQLIVLFSICDVLITNDSGPAHFASMTKIQNIVLFGPETPLLYGPIDGNPHPLWAGLACSPCVNALNHRLSPCNNNLCMQAISVEQVMAKLRSCLKSDAVQAAHGMGIAPPVARSSANDSFQGGSHAL